MKYWLVKTEPRAYSIDDLKRDGTTAWDGVRNFQARNYMRDQMQPGDPVLFYHSSVEPMAVVGVAEVASTSYPDESAFDPNDHHFDPKSSRTKPTWYLVDLKFVEKFAKPVTLAELKKEPALKDMVLTQRGSRLSVQPVREEEFEVVCRLAK